MTATKTRFSSGSNRQVLPVIPGLEPASIAAFDLEGDEK